MIEDDIIDSDKGNLVVDTTIEDFKELLFANCPLSKPQVVETTIEEFKELLFANCPLSKPQVVEITIEDFNELIDYFIEEMKTWLRDLRQRGGGEGDGFVTADDLNTIFDGFKYNFRNSLPICDVTRSWTLRPWSGLILAGRW